MQLQWGWAHQADGEPKCKPFLRYYRGDHGGDDHDAHDGDAAHDDHVRDRGDHVHAHGDRGLQGT